MSRKSDKCIDKKCPAGKICNPLTGRCILDKGMPNFDIFKIRNRVRIINSVEEYINSKYNNARLIGKGVYGSVYEFQVPSGGMKVVKVIETKTENEMYNTIREIYLQDIFYRMNIAPQIYSAEMVLVNVFNFIIIEMEKIDGDIENLFNKNDLDENTIVTIIREIITMVDIYRKNGYTHGDLHWGNIGYKIEKPGKIRLYLLDYGMACCISNILKDKDSYLYEITQLLRTVRFASENSNNAYVIKKVLTNIYANFIEKLGDKTIGYEIFLNYIDKIKADPDRTDKILYNELYADLFYKSYRNYLNTDVNKIKENIIKSKKFVMTGDIKYVYKPQIIELK